MLRRLVTSALTLMLCAIAGPSLAASPAPREVLVLGGTGQLGAEIVRLLVQQGDHVMVLTRGKSDHARLQGLPVTYVTGDLTNEADVAAAFRGRRIEYVVNAVRAERSDLHFYEKVMPALVSNAKAAGVKQFVHQSAAGAGGSLAKMDTAGWDKVPGLLERIRDQTVGEEMLTRSGVPYTIVRNARLYPDGTPATGKAELTEDESVMTPMTRPDLARLTVSCVGNAVCLNKIYHVKDTTLSWPPPGGMR